MRRMPQHNDSLSRLFPLLIPPNCSLCVHVYECVFACVCFIIHRLSFRPLTLCMWSTHSWNIGPVHIVSFSTEVYFYLKYGQDLLFKQYEWLQKDLEVLRYCPLTPSLI